jgi:ribonuclease HI
MDPLLRWVGAGAGLLFISPLGEHMRYAVRLHFPVSKNMAEYEALLAAFESLSKQASSKCLDVRGDSQLVIDQVMKNESCHDEKMETYCNVVRASRTNSTTSSSITSLASTMWRRMNSQLLRLGESPFP